MNIKRLILLVLPWALFILASTIVWKQCKSSEESTSEDKTVVNHHMVVEKMEALGKIEMVKYYIKDIVEHEEIKSWWPDPKVVLIVSGEVVGCIDLTKVDSSDIKIEQNQITIKLPTPIICYFKINHNESKVYHMENEYFSQSELIDKAYKVGEKQLEMAATKMKILEQTKTNAEIFLKPFLEELTGKKVILAY